MSAFHRRLIADRFREHGGTLTTAQLAAAAGPRWPDRVREMRAVGYLLVGEDAAGLWHLDLEAIPASDVGRAVDAADSRGAWEGDGSSPDPRTTPEQDALPLDDVPSASSGHYDDEAA